MLRKEELQSALEGTMDPQQLERTMEHFTEEFYGSEEKYQQRLAEHAAELDEAQRNEPSQSYQEEQAEFKKLANEIVNLDAAVQYERLKSVYMHQGRPEALAEMMARTEVMQQYGDNIYIETPLDAKTERELKILENHFYVNEDDKKQIVVLMRLEGLNAHEALNKLNQRREAQQRNEEEEYFSMSDKEREFTDLLTPDDKSALRNLKAIQPEAKWTAEKYWRMLHEGKRKPRKIVEHTAMEKEETIDYNLYDREVQETKKVERKLAAMYYNKFRQDILQTGLTIDDVAGLYKSQFNHDISEELEIMSKYGYSL